MRPRRAAALLLGALVACAHPPPEGALTTERDVDLCGEGGDAQVITVEYLRAGGLRMHLGEAEIATAPFYSNPGLLRLGVWSIAPDPDRIVPHATALGRPAAVLVGHAHYDHLMDLPTLLRAVDASIPIHASRTAKNLLAGERDLTVVAVDETAGTNEKAGSWHDAPGLRWMALHSEHGPHVAGLKVYGGTVTEPQSELPRTAWGW